MEAAVGALWCSFASKLALGVFGSALEREEPGGVGEETGGVFFHAPADYLTIVGEIRQTDLGDARSR